MSVERLQEILHELDECDRAVGESLDTTTRRQVDLLTEGFRLLAGPIIELRKQQTKRKGKS